MVVSASFDEFKMEIAVTYPGAQIEFPEVRPSLEEIRDREDGTRLLAGFMLRRNADRVRSQETNAQCIVHFDYDH